jgi:two-component system, chemotaxis family, chemotaxis protein CheY
MARIMIVDDVASIRSIVTSMLEKHGHRVFSVGSGDEAIQLAKAKRVHLVITDVNMPGMDGLTLISQMKQIEHFKSTPIAVLAKGAKDENVDKAKAAGACDWIVKPFTEDSLNNKINQILVDYYVN